MAKNLLEPVKPVESDSESGADENDGAFSEEASSESDSEPEFTKKASDLPAAALKKSGPQSGSKTQPQQLSSSSSDEEDSGSEPESDSDGPDPKLSHIAAKARDGAKKPKGGAGKPGASEPVIPDKSTGNKRAAEGKESEATGAKRSKKKPDNSDKNPIAGSKKQNFQRFFSEDDEIAVLKGMIGYAEKYESDPFADLNAFREFVKDDLQVDPTRNQLLLKMRRFKQKYDRNKRKEEAGKCRSLKAHERRAYELSKHVWGNESGKAVKSVGSSKAANKSGARKTQGKNADGNDVAENAKNAVAVNGNLNKLTEIVSLNDVVSMDRNVARIGAKLFDAEKGVEGEGEWKKLTMAEMEVYLKKLELMTAKTKLVLDVLKANNY